MRFRSCSVFGLEFSVVIACCCCYCWTTLAVRRSRLSRPNGRSKAHEIARISASRDPRGRQLRARVFFRTANSRRGVPDAKLDDDALKSRNNSAHFWLGSAAKARRGVMRGLGEIKILQGEIREPQSEIRAHVSGISTGKARSCWARTPRSVVLAPNGTPLKGGRGRNAHNQTRH